MMNSIKLIWVAGLLTLLAACSDQQPATTVAAEQTTETILREANFAEVSHGGRLFASHCAVCHGARGEGAVNWRVRDAEGYFPPPPLNGTGHAWHHPQKVLHDVIKNGSPGGQGRMLAWKDKLSDGDIEAIIAWFKSQWPDEAFAAWYQMNRGAESGS
jgi:mono/diheme cytochrome c family protein